MHAGDLLSDRARITPDREAILEVATGQRLNYAELNARANRCANALRGMGAQKGDRVSILAQNSLAHIDLLYGCAKIGAIFAPLNWRLTATELSYIVNDCAPHVLVCGPEYAGVLEAMRGQVSIPKMLGLDGAKLDGGAYDDALAAASSAEPDHPPLAADDPLCILYTSGTTGNPKGAVLPHRQIFWNALNTVVSWGLNEDDVSPVLTPLFHAGGLFAFLTPILFAGGRVLLAKGFDAAHSLEMIQTEGCTAILGVPTLFQMWQNTPGFAAADFSRVRFFISGGAPCPPALMQEWREQKRVGFRQGFGMTEVGVNCFTMTNQDAIRKPGKVGRPILGTRVRLMDPETGKDVAQGQTGELLFNGPHTCLGYWQNEKATQAAFFVDENGDKWFKSGDGAVMDEDGFYAIAGRFKDMIKSGGENIYAAEVETVFRQHEGVADAALIGLPDEKWGEVGVMIVLPKPGSRPAPEELLRFCDGRLARFKIPKRVILSESLPYSPYGKVIKSELKRILNAEC